MKRFVALFAVLALLMLSVLPVCADTEILTGASEPEQEDVILNTEADPLPIPGGDIILIAPAPEGDDVQKDSFTGSEELLDTPIPPTTGAESEGEDGFIFAPGNFVTNLSYMATGMIGIFIVIGLIVLATVVLNSLFKEKAEKSE